MDARDRGGRPRRRRAAKPRWSGTRDVPGSWDRRRGSAATRRVDDVCAGLVQDRERLLGGVEVGIAAQMKGTNAHWCPFQGSEGLADGRGGRGSVGGGAHRRGARGAAHRDGRARCELDAAREAAKAVAAIVVQARTIGAAAESGRDSNCRGVRGRTSPAVPCRCADACVALGGGLGERGAPAHAVSIAATARRIKT